MKVLTIRIMVAVSIVLVFAVAVHAQPGGNPPVIVDAIINFSNQTLTIDGQNFGAALPNVILGNLPLAVLVSNPMQIVAQFPLGTFADGSYRLQVQRTAPPVAIGTFDVAVTEGVVPVGAMILWDGRLVLTASEHTQDRATRTPFFTTGTESDGRYLTADAPGAAFDRICGGDGSCPVRRHPHTHGGTTNAAQGGSMTGTSGPGGGDAITGTSAAADNLPPFRTIQLCRR